MGVGACGGEDFLFVEIAGGVGANGEADETDAGTDEDGARDGAGEPEHDDGKQVADSDAPASEEVERRSCGDSEALADGVENLIH